METNLQKRFETKDIASSKIARELLPIVGNDGDYIEVRGKDALVTQIKNLLMTPLGTYPFDPEYGSLLYKQLFEPIDEVTERQIYYEVRDRVLMYVEGVNVDSVNLIWDKEHKKCTVNVVYTIQDEINKSTLSLEVKNAVANMYGSIDDETYADYRF